MVSGSKCQSIGALVKANHKRLKAALALGIRKLGVLFLVLKLSKFSLFDKFFPDLADFRDLDNFLPFKFPGFLVYSTPSLPNLSNSMLLLFFPKASQLPLFLLEAGQLPSFLPEANSLDDLIVFNIKVTGATILLKL